MMESSSSGRVTKPMVMAIIFLSITLLTISMLWSSRSPTQGSVDYASTALRPSYTCDCSLACGAGTGFTSGASGHSSHHPHTTSHSSSKTTPSSSEESEDSSDSDKKTTKKKKQKNDNDSESESTPSQQQEGRTRGEEEEQEAEEGEGHSHEESKNSDAKASDLDGKELDHQGHHEVIYSKRELAMPCDASITPQLPDMRDKEHLPVCVHTFFDIASCSKAPYAAKRNAVRSTWLKIAEAQNGFRFAYRFFVGQPETEEEKTAIAQEIAQHGDIVILQCSDAYNQLPCKSARSFAWADEHFRFIHLFKSDDDSFVRADRWWGQVPGLPKQAMWLGEFRYNNQPITDPNNKNYEPQWQLFPHGYPPYVAGCGYALSEDLIHYIGHSLDFLKFLSNEDITVAFWMSTTNHQKIDRREQIIPGGGCRPGYLVSHYAGPDTMNIAYQDFLSGRECSF